MPNSIQDTWDRFERWASRFKKVCEERIEEMFECGYSDIDGGLFVCKRHEFGGDLLLDCTVFRSELSERISEKINFIRGYLVDISFDGPDFMARHSKFLSLQYPSQCNNAIGVWLEQDLEVEDEPGGYFRFQGWDVSFFCKEIRDVDLASMRNVLPFDRMFVRRPKGIAWDRASSKKFLRDVKSDLEFDYHVQVEMGKDLSYQLLTLEFTWQT